MKTWQKIAIGCVVALILSCVIAAVLIGVFGYGAFNQLTAGFTDPEVKLAKAKEICDFTLPDNYDVAFSMDMGFMKIAAIEHKPSKQMVMFIELPKQMRIPNKEFEKALTQGSKEEILEAINKNSQGGSMKVTDIKDTGVYEIKGQRIPYFEAEFEHNGKPADGILANYDNPDTGQAFMIMAMAEKGKYNSEITMTFLDSLKFK